MAAGNKQTAEVVRIILLFFSYSLFQNISYAKGTIELYRKDVRGMHLVIYLIHSSTDTVGRTILTISCISQKTNISFQLLLVSDARGQMMTRAWINRTKSRTNENYII